MKQQTNAQVHVLDRVLYLLEENSVSHLVAEDKAFADFISSLYGTIESKATTLKAETPIASASDHASRI